MMCRVFDLSPFNLTNPCRGDIPSSRLGQIRLAVALLTAKSL